MALSNKIDAFAGNLELASKVAIEYKNFLNETIYRRIRRCCTNQQERLFPFIFEESNEKKKYEQYSIVIRYIMREVSNRRIC